MTGKCIIFSAPSGAGKTTIVRYLLERGLNLAFSISACTRDKRGNEVDGKDYYFLTTAEFQSKINNGAFIEWEEVYKDQYYGTLKASVERILEEGKHVIFDVDVVGGLSLKKYFGENACSIFVKPPSIETLEERLKLRATETPEKIAKRMAKAKEEMDYSAQFDHIVLNDNLEKACQEAYSIVEAFLNSN